MTAILVKILSMLMSAVVFLSGTFPALFDGKQYIDPYGDEVHIGDFYYFHKPEIINDYETLSNIGSKGCIVYGLPERYDSEYFKDNSLVIFSVKMSHEYFRIWVKSVVENGDTLEVEYGVVEDYVLHALIVNEQTSEIIIETSKNIKNVELVRSDITVPFDIKYIDQDPTTYFDEFYYM